MKIENFKLVEVENQQIIEIDYLGEIFDLHNAAEFLKIDYVIKTSILTLFWNYYFDEKNIIPFQIMFEGVQYFEIFPRDSEMPKVEDDCLKEIVHGEKFEFRFMGGMKIVAKADKVSFEKT
ncbi:MAG: hypothetical protein HND27_10815 [Bacteroidetes bacterium]|nr:hypothetical protein [Bacteroidota bacterium]NOG96253.1 hypothetical protein [Bacteroidota bacterium]GIK68933.1 MAG: hypothetical protein BroJett020_02280 [Bacteroidota bacterium]